MLHKFKSSKNKRYHINFLFKFICEFTKNICKSALIIPSNDKAISVGCLIIDSELIP